MGKPNGICCSPGARRKGHFYRNLGVEVISGGWRLDGTGLQRKAGVRWKDMEAWIRQRCCWRCPGKREQEKAFIFFFFPTLQYLASTSLWLNLPEARGQLKLGNLDPSDTEKARRMAGTGLRTNCHWTAGCVYFIYLFILMYLNFF